MFGTISVPVPRPMFVDSELWDVDVDLAQALMTSYSSLMATAKAFHTVDEHEMEVKVAMVAIDMRSAAHGYMEVYRVQFEMRTERERRDAEETVADCRAQFLSGPLSYDECLDCTLLMRDHIAILDGGTLCPFGRQYWHLARALCTRTVLANYGDGAQIMRRIARRSAK